MTIFEVADHLPNGLHDAEVEAIRIDYPLRTMEITLDVWTGTMDESPSARETYRRALLTITGLHYCAMDVPDARYPFAQSTMLTIGLAEPTEFQPASAAFACRLWVNEWNACIHISATSADLRWQGEPVIHDA